jgi:2-polyprenyl-6-methoxyphenol hydroxylase-like FAD-dependent oxidoreductase
MESLKVLIIGGGIAGPALAHWLSRTGAQITLAERSPHVRASGQQVDLRAQGVDMMRKMDIEAAVRAAAVHEEGMQLVDREGRTHAFFPANTTGKGRQSFTSEYEIMRGDLVQILYGLTEGRANVRHLFGTTVKAFTQDPEEEKEGKVHVTFDDDRAEDFDLVVAADGTGSRTRAMMLGPDAPDPRNWMGGSIAYFSVPSEPGDWDRFTGCVLPGPRSGPGRIIGTRKDCPELTRVYMLVRGSDAAVDAAHRSGSLADLKSAYAGLYEGGGWQCARFVDGLRNAPEADDLYSTPLIEVALPEKSWSKGRVVLLGDSAQSQTGNGLGCTWALVGAYVLAGEIAERLAGEGATKTEAVVQGAQAYEEKFRPISTANHGGTQWFGDFMFPRTAFAIGVFYAFARLMAYFRIDQLANIDSSTSKWQLPEYPVLDTDRGQ